MKFLKKIPDWLRWILFLPTAFLVLLIIYPIVTIINRITIIGFGEGFLVDLGILVLANLWSAVGFIWVGAIVVPKHHFITSIVLSLLYGFWLGGGFVVKLMLGEKLNVSWLEMAITIITGIIAAVWVIQYFHKKERLGNNDFSTAEHDLL